MNKASKNRLMPWHAAMYPNDSLYGRIARTVCQAGTLPRKELHEAWEVAKRVRREYRGGRVVDLACGQGLLAHILMILDATSEMALAVDVRIPKNVKKLCTALWQSWPNLARKVHYLEIPLSRVEILPGDLVVSVHACGALTDQVLDKAVAGRARIAVLPCCHSVKVSPGENLAGWMAPDLAIDTLRALKLQARGYHIMTRKIPGTITPKNRLLMGHPACAACAHPAHDLI